MHPLKGGQKRTHTHTAHQTGNTEPDRTHTNALTHCTELQREEWQPSMLRKWVQICIFIYVHHTVVSSCTNLPCCSAYITSTPLMEADTRLAKFRKKREKKRKKQQLKNNKQQTFNSLEIKCKLGSGKCNWTHLSARPETKMRMGWWQRCHTATPTPRRGNLHQHDTGGEKKNSSWHKGDNGNSRQHEEGDNDPMHGTLQRRARVCQTWSTRMQLHMTRESKCTWQRRATPYDKDVQVHMTRETNSIWQGSPSTHDKGEQLHMTRESNSIWQLRESMSTCQGSTTSHDKGVQVHTKRESKSTWQGSPTRWQLRKSKSTWCEWKKKKPVHKTWSQQTQLQTTWSQEMRPSSQHQNSEKRVLMAWVAFHKTGGWGTQLHTTGTRNPHDLNEETTENKPPPPPPNSENVMTWHQGVIPPDMKECSSTYIQNVTTCMTWEKRLQVGTIITWLSTIWKLRKCDHMTWQWRRWFHMTQWRRVQIHTHVNEFCITHNIHLLHKAMSNKMWFDMTHRWKQLHITPTSHEKVTLHSKNVTP